MTKLDYLSQIVINIVNNFYDGDIEEYEDGIYNIVDLPQSPKELDRAIEIASKHGFNIYDMREDGYVTISSGKTFIRFNLYETDEPYYGNKGDINSLDISKDVYDNTIKLLYNVSLLIV